MIDLTRELRQLHHASFQWALHCTGGSRHDAEDALQSAYEALLDGSASFEERSSLKSFLFAVIRNKARSASRKKSLLSLVGLDNISTPSVQPQVHNKMDDAERVAAIRAAIQQLSPRQRDVLELVFYHELTVEEAADVLDLQLGTARTHYARAKKALRRQLTKEDFQWKTNTIET